MTVTRFSKVLVVLRMALFCLLAFAGADSSVASDCDPALMGVTNNPLGYRQRGDRCEGIYWEPHAARDMISVVSYTGGHLPTATLISDPLLIAWATEADSSSSEPVRVRATALKEGLYFRMDATRPRSSSNYPWPTDVLRKLQLNLRDLGFIASTKENVAGVNWTVYLPVSIGVPLPSSPSLALVLVATTPINGLDWECLSIEESTGLPGNRVTRGQLPGSFQVLEPIPLGLPISGFSGLCYLEIRTKAADFGLGRPLVTSVVIRIPRYISASGQSKKSHGPQH